MLSQPSRSVFQKYVILDSNKTNHGEIETLVMLWKHDILEKRICEVPKRKVTIDNEKSSILNRVKD